MAPSGWDKVKADAEGCGVDMFVSCCAAHPEMVAAFQFGSGKADDPKVKALAGKVFARIAIVADGGDAKLGALGAQHKGFPGFDVSMFAKLKPHFANAVAKRAGAGAKAEYEGVFDSIASAMS